MTNPIQWGDMFEMNAWDKYPVSFKFPTSDIRNSCLAINLFPLHNLLELY
jgi:hypothetical protein